MIMTYISRCWVCHSPISSDINCQCPFCSWYICASCGACRSSNYKDCFNDELETITDSEERSFMQKEFEKLKKDVALSHERLERMSIIVKAEDERKRAEAEIQRIEKWREDREKEKEQRNAEFERLAALRKTFCPGTIVFTRSGTHGVVLNYTNDSSQFTYMQVSLNDKNGERRATFVFPDAIDQGFIFLQKPEV